MVKSYGALPTVTVTALRKVLTIVMSFFLFEKPFTMQYVWSGLLVLLGISFNIYRLVKQRSVFFTRPATRSSFLHWSYYRFFIGSHKV